MSDARSISLFWTSHLLLQPARFLILHPPAQVFPHRDLSQVPIRRIQCAHKKLSLTGIQSVGISSSYTQRGTRRTVRILDARHRLLIRIAPRIAGVPHTELMTPGFATSFAPTVQLAQNPCLGRRAPVAEIPALFPKKIVVVFAHLPMFSNLATTTSDT